VVRRSLSRALLSCLAGGGALLAFWSVAFWSGSTTAKEAAPVDPRPELRRVAERARAGLVRVRLVRGAPRGDAVRRELFRRVPDRRAGTGILVGERRVLVHAALTAYTEPEFEVTDSSGRTRRARLIRESRDAELALLEATGPLAGKPLEWRRTHGLRTGELVLAVGDPFGLARGGALSATFGVVEGRTRLDVRESAFAGEVLLTSAALNPGSEGGALLDLEGRLLGLLAPLAQDRRLEAPTRASKSATALTAYALPAEACQRTLSGWSRPKLGFQAREVEGRVTIVRVGLGTPAARAGLEKGDVLAKVGGRAIQSTTQLRLALAGAGPHSLEVTRGEETLSLELKP